ncbi:SbcC/MukB-like Walker B domain-containing protein [Streptomyces sp. NPDC012616]|uniref:SbcC/MukB-like Walker B domain-containing protein n=1 Tax=Streptomyces sp. NPDC012616 TaxID=3364840 RepID=UPI0036EA56E8
MLWPTFLDGSVVSRSLSAAAEAAGTLTTIHTLGRPGPPKSGTWWQEYARTDPGDHPQPTTRWLTTGLWLHSGGGQRTSIERAWFIAPARVHADLVLERGGIPITIDDLAAQLPAHGGKLFTSSDRLERECRDHAGVLRKEEDYPEAIREAMYQPFDAARVDALATVLRALRSVQANDKISPQSMQDTLTSALPALDARRVRGLADALNKSEELQQRLNAHRTEHRLLGSIQSAYRRYAAAVAVSVALAYHSAHTLHQDTARRHQRACADLDTQQQSLDEALAAESADQQRNRLLGQTVKTLEKRLAGHPGASLDDLDETARRAEQSAAESQADARRAADHHQQLSAASDQQTLDADHALAALRTLTLELGHQAAQVAGDAFHKPLADAHQHLAHQHQEQQPPDPQRARAARDQARVWSDTQLKAAERVHDAQRELQTHLHMHKEAQETYEACRQQADQKAELAHQATQQAEQTDAAAREALSRYSTRLRRLPAPPDDLSGAVPLDAEAIHTWVNSQAEQILAGLDLGGVQAHAEALERTARAATDQAAAAATTADRARQALARHADALAAHTARLAAPAALHDLLRSITGPAAPEHLTAGLPEPIEDDLHTAITEHRRLLQHAAVCLSAACAAADTAATRTTAARQHRMTADQAEQHAHDHQAVADRSASQWAHAVLDWADRLTVIDASRLPLPSATKRPQLSTAPGLAHEVDEAYQRVISDLTPQLAAAQQRLDDDTRSIEALDEQIARARRGHTPPETPNWRAPRHDRGGAPLWNLVDFAPHVTPEQRGLLEGALLAAGLLDAWISPDGTARAGDVVLKAAPAPDGPTLAGLLIPDHDAPVPARHVQAVLAGIQILPAGQRPSPGQTAVQLDGSAQLGPLAAQAPSGWQARHIGAAARERARQQHLNDLTRQREQAATESAASRRRLQEVQQKLTTARAERTLPRTDDWQRAETAADTHHKAATQARRQADMAQQDAEQAQAAHQQAIDIAEQTCAQAALAPDADAVTLALDLYTELPGHIARALTAAREAGNANRLQQEAKERAATADHDRHAAAQALAAARATAKEVEHDTQTLPSQLADLAPARKAVEEAQRTAQSAASQAHAAETRLGRFATQLHKATTVLHTTAATAGTAPLPTEAPALDSYRTCLTHLCAGLDTWSDAAHHTHHTTQLALHGRAALQEAERHAQQQHKRAETAGHGATQARHRYFEERRQHGKPFQELTDELAQQRDEQDTLVSRLLRHRTAIDDARTRHIQAGERLVALAGRRDEAAAGRANALTRLQGLFDHGLADELADSADLPRPEDADTALDTARALLKRSTAPGDITVDKAAAHEKTARQTLEETVRNNLAALLKVHRHAVTEEIASTGWRRITLASLGHSGDRSPIGPNAEPLHTALERLRHAIDTLEGDFTTQVQTEVKGVVFSELRKDITRRIATAQSIVQDITQTLEGIRTGVAHVGVRLAWKPSTDPTAAKALKLVQAADTSGTFDDLYDFFVKRLQDEEDRHPTWAERVEHVFDYRNWFTWDIELTHDDFRDDPDSTTEAFRPLTRRSNPLARLSGGEKRLATMLPLLAAARAFYSTDGYQGPHCVFIDELDAAFDAANLRRLLALLRAWDFDAILTLPAMRPLLVAESQTVGIHRIHKRDATTRYTVSSIWNGHGIPHPTKPQPAFLPPAGAN